MPTAPPIDRSRLGRAPTTAPRAARMGAVFAVVILGVSGLLAGCAGQERGGGTQGAATPTGGSSLNAAPPAAQSGLVAGDRAAIDAVLTAREIALTTGDRQAYA
ncbi:MAG: hypothetical protein WBL35_17475, partial [Ornithinibacter sp.]